MGINTFAIVSIFGTLMYFSRFMDCSKIIALTPYCTRSHKNVFMPLIEELASRGHEIILVSPMISAQTISRVIEIDIPNNLKILNSMQQNIFNKSAKGGLISHLREQMISIQESTKNFLKHDEILNLIKSGQKFDLAIINGRMNDVCFMIAPLLAKNIIVLTPGSIPPPNPLAFPIPLSTTPVPHLGFTSEMNFFQRLKNLISCILIAFIYPYFLQNEVQKITWKQVPEALSIAEGKKEFSLLLNNADPVLSTSTPTSSASINIGGMHCKESGKLPKIFTDFIENDDDGKTSVIVFSLGSVIPAKLLPKSILREFIAAFKQLNQRVIWKYEDSLEDLPKNVLLTPWMPQQDVLGHPKVKLFITHGGTLSLQEAVYHGVPVIGIPFFADQPGNIARIVQLGLGEKLDILGAKTSMIVETVNRIMNNHSYSENMQKYSSIMRNEMEHPVKRATYWAEYVIRHGGARHLHDSFANMNIFNYFSFDVIFSIAIILIVTSGFILFCTKYIFMKFTHAR